MASVVRLLILCIAALALTGCSDPAATPSPLISRPAAAGPIYVLEKTVKARPTGGKSRALRQGSAWTEFGTVAEGVVYRPTGGALTIEGVNVSEAYIVVHDGSWVGFWLPVEKAFAAVDQPVPIAMSHGGAHWTPESPAR